MCAPLKVAISGGGIASLCLVHALLRIHPQWEVMVFEASTEFRDEGAAFGVGEKAQETLELISPELRKALDDAGAVKMESSVRLMMGTGPEAGRHIGDISADIPQLVVHRGRFWRVLHSLLPNNTISFGKKLARVAGPSNDYSVELYFEDGTSYGADALIGCDGINSIVRGAVLGEDHPATLAKMSGGYGHRVVVPIEKAREVFGEEYCSLQSQYGWIGDHGLLITDHMNEGRSMQVIAGWSSRGEAWPYSTPYVEWPKEKLVSDLANWGDIGKAMTKIFTDQPKLYAAGSRIHLDTPTYCRGPICIAGDAAQTFSPAQGAGAGQAMEDALMLSTVLGVCTASQHIHKAFRVYDSLRRPRRADIARSSKWAGELLTGQAPGIGLDRERIAAYLPTWGANINDYDLVAAQTEALRQMQEDE